MLASDLKVHRCGLEKAKDAALAAQAQARASGETTPSRGLKRARAEAATDTPGLNDVKIHKSGLERAKEAATHKQATPGAAQRKQRRAEERKAQEWAQWDTQSLDAVTKPHMSKMEKEVAAWKAAAAKKEQRNVKK